MRRFLASATAGSLIGAFGFALAAAALTGGCGGSDTADDANGGDETPQCTPIVLNGGGGIPEPPNGAEACAEGTCNYQTQEGCPATQSCRPQFPAGATSVTPGCEAAGSGRSGQACESSAQCARGYFCASGACRKMCCGGDWSACDAGESCIRQFFVAFGSRREHAVDLCFPVGTCDPFEEGSCDGESADAPRECKIVDPTGAVACAPVSSRTLGQTCAPPDVCAQGLTCVGGVCIRLCRISSGDCADPGCPSPDDTCIHFDRNPPGVGECTP